MVNSGVVPNHRAITDFQTFASAEIGILLNLDPFPAIVKYLLDQPSANPMGNLPAWEWLCGEVLRNPVIDGSGNYSRYLAHDLFRLELVG